MSDDLPAEVRRLNWGWFGEPWPSGVCYDDDGRLREEMRKPFPTGEICLYCDVCFDEAAGDAGQAMPVYTIEGGAEVRHGHRECMLRTAVGSLAHLEGRCRCSGAPDPDSDDLGMTRRQEALAVWAWCQDHPVS